MTRVCWLLGHKYVDIVHTGQYSPEEHLNVMTGQHQKVPYVVRKPFDYCIRCGTDKPKAKPA